MTFFLFCILILIALALLVYTGIQYSRRPEKHYQQAKETGDFFLLNDKNEDTIQFIYKGCRFEGEKHLGTVENAFEIVRIHISVQNPSNLDGFTREDIYFLESEILLYYPHAAIEWRRPIDELLLTNIES